MSAKNKKITIEDLAGMVKRGFDKVDVRFDRVDLKFEKVEARLDRIEKKLEGVVYLREFEELKDRVEILEEALAIKSSK